MSTSANFVGRAGLAATGTRSHFSGRRHVILRPTSHQTPNHHPPRFSRTRPESLEWEVVEEIFQSSRPRFIGVAYSILRNREDAEDAVQDAFISAYRHLRTFEGRSAFTTWFTRIVLNAALMIRRKRKPSRIESFSESSSTDEVSWTERIPDSQPDPEMLCAEKETFQLLDSLLGKMTPVLRQAFTMTYYDEMSTAEAVALLGVSTGTFKSRVFRARQFLMNMAQRSLVAPIRSADFHFSYDEIHLNDLAARPSEMGLREMTFS